MKTWSASVTLLLLVAMPWCMAAQTAQQPAEKEPVPSCADCHDEAKAFATNPHARGADKTAGIVTNDACVPCHGDGTEHATSGGDKAKIAKPVGLAGAEETCMLCHDATTDRISRRAGMHANSSTVNCLTCHSIHHGDPKSPHLVARPQLQLCGSCHTQAAGFVNKPYRHRLDRGGMECSSCHEPHGRPTPAAQSMAMLNSLRTTTSGEVPCVSCHREKRGPFVFQHGANVVGDCINCHEVHGSSNPMQLRRSTVLQVCIECHSPITGDTLGSQPPAFHNLSNPRYRNCTTCHVAVHGSNRDPKLLK